MARTVAEWQITVDRVFARFKENYLSVLTLAPSDARAAVAKLNDIKKVMVSSDLGKAAFRLDRKTATLELSLAGLNLIWEAGESRDFRDLDIEDFCETAVSIYLFHEMQHVAQRMVDFADVQTLKQTAGPHKLGELDVIADAVAAQIFATLYAADFGNDRRIYASAFFNALRFMIEFCFPAFGFPLGKKHKVQRALGVVLMAVLTERAIRNGEWDAEFDAPLYPAFSKNFTKMALLSYAGSPSISIVQFTKSLKTGSVKEMLELIDSDHIDKILDRARELV